MSGIRIRPANGSNLTSVVGSIDKYMERHVIGAGKEKFPDNALSIHRIAIAAADSRPAAF